MSVIAAKAAIRVYAGPDGTIGSSLVVAAGAGPRLNRSRSARSGEFSGKRGPSLGVPLATPSRAVGHLSHDLGVTSVTSGWVLSVRRRVSIRTVR